MCFEYEYFLSSTYRIPKQCVDTEIDEMAVALARNHQLFVNNANVARPFRILPQIHTHTNTYKKSGAACTQIQNVINGLPAFSASDAACRSEYFN